MNKSGLHARIAMMWSLLWVGSLFLAGAVHAEQRFPVVIDVDNADLSLLPGMTASATIEVARRNDVLRVANAALRFKPDGGSPPPPPRDRR